VPVTKAQRLAYQRKLRDIAKQARNIEDNTYRAMSQALKSYWSNLNRELASLATDRWGRMTVHQMGQIKDYCASSIPALQAQLQEILKSGQSQIWELGTKTAIDSLSALGLQIGGAPIFSPEQFKVATAFSADLISNVTSDMLGKINAQLGLAALGGKTPFDAMKGIEEILGIKTDKGVAYKAERIYRTEVNRIYSIANRSQIEKLGEEYGERLLHGWIAAEDERTRETHLEAHERYSPQAGEPIPYNEPFIIRRPGGGEDRMMCPLDPAGSPENTINCRCQEVILTAKD